MARNKDYILKAKFFVFCFYLSVMNVNALKNPQIFNIAFGQNKLTSVTVPDFKKQLKNDVFERSSAQKTDKNDFLSLSKQEIIDRVLFSVKQRENYIGCGGDARVYKIENTDYCVRLPYKSGDLKNTTLSFDLKEQDRINHTVAKFSNGAAIMKYIEGFTLSKRSSQGKLSQSVVDRALLDLPVSAFHGLFKQVCHAKDNGMIFDCSSTNVILDTKKQALTAIDFYEMLPEEPEDIKPLRFMQASLTEGADFALKKKCALKIILGALEELKPGVKPCMNIGEFGFRDFVDNVQIGNDISPSKEWVILKDVLTDVLCLKIKEIAGCNVNDLLEYKIEEAQTMAQVLSSCV